MQMQPLLCLMCAWLMYAQPSFCNSSLGGLGEIWKPRDCQSFLLGQGEDVIRNMILTVSCNQGVHCNGEACCRRSSVSSNCSHCQGSIIAAAVNDAAPESSRDSDVVEHSIHYASHEANAGEVLLVLLHNCQNVIRTMGRWVDEGRASIHWQFVDDPTSSDGSTEEH